MKQMGKGKMPAFRRAWPGGTGRRSAAAGDGGAGPARPESAAEEERRSASAVVPCTSSGGDMAVKLRLTRVGSKKNPIYRVVAADSRSPRDGKFIEIVGRYNPQTDPSTDRARRGQGPDWLGKGAQPTEAVARLLKVQEHRLSWRAARVPRAAARRRSGRRARRDATSATAPSCSQLHVAPGRRRQGDRPPGPHRARAAHGRARERGSGSASASCSRSLSDVSHVSVGRVGRPHGLDGSFVVEHPSEARRAASPSAPVVLAGGAAGARRRAQARRRAARDPARPAVAARDRSSRSRAPSCRRPGTTTRSTSSSSSGSPSRRRAAARSAASPDVEPGPANDVLELDSGLALPLVAACVREVDLERGRIVVAPGFADPE